MREERTHKNRSSSSSPNCADKWLSLPFLCPSYLTPQQMTPLACVCSAVLTSVLSTTSEEAVKWLADPFNMGVVDACYRFAGTTGFRQQTDSPHSRKLWPLPLVAPTAQRNGRSLWSPWPSRCQWCCSTDGRSVMLTAYLHLVPGL